MFNERQQTHRIKRSAIEDKKNLFSSLLQLKKYVLILDTFTVCIRSAKSKSMSQLKQMFSEKLAINQRPCICVNVYNSH